MIASLWPSSPVLSPLLQAEAPPHPQFPRRNRQSPSTLNLLGQSPRHLRLHARGYLEDQPLGVARSPRLRRPPQVAARQKCHAHPVRLCSHAPTHKLGLSRNRKGEPPIVPQQQLALTP